MPKGKALLQWMAQNLTDLPPDALAGLQAASDQMKG